MDKDAVKVVKGNETVGHLPREFSRIAWYFLACLVDDIVNMEIPCQLEFNCSNKVQMKRLKELLASKIWV